MQETAAASDKGMYLPIRSAPVKAQHKSLIAPKFARDPATSSLLGPAYFLCGLNQECIKSQRPVKEPVNRILLHLPREMEINLQSQADS